MLVIIIFQGLEIDGIGLGYCCVFFLVIELVSCVCVYLQFILYLLGKFWSSVYCKNGVKDYVWLWYEWDGEIILERSMRYMIKYFVGICD